MIEDDQKNLFDENPADKNPPEENLTGEHAPDVKKNPAKKKFKKFLKDSFEEGRYFYGYFLQEKFLYQDVQDQNFQGEIEKIYKKLKDGESCKDEVREIYENPEGADLPAKIAAPFFSNDSTKTTSVSLKSIGQVKGVNALDGNQTLSFVREESDKNGSGGGLAIVYGDNASGKSGYVRILKSACSALIKNENILPNVYEERDQGVGGATGAGGEDEKENLQNNSQAGGAEGEDTLQKALISFSTEEVTVGGDSEEASKDSLQNSKQDNRDKTTTPKKVPHKVYWNLKYVPSSNSEPFFTPDAVKTSDGNGGSDGERGSDDGSAGGGDGGTATNTPENSNNYEKVLDLLKNIKIFDEDAATFNVNEKKEIEIVSEPEKALRKLRQILDKIEKKFDDDIGERKGNDGKKVDVEGGRRDKFKKNFDGTGGGDGSSAGENFKAYFQEAGECFKNIIEEAGKDLKDDLASEYEDDFLNELEGLTVAEYFQRDFPGSSSALLENVLKNIFSGLRGNSTGTNILNAKKSGNEENSKSLEQRPFFEFEKKIVLLALLLGLMRFPLKKNSEDILEEIKNNFSTEEYVPSTQIAKDILKIAQDQLPSIDGDDGVGGAKGGGTGRTQDGAKGGGTGDQSDDNAGDEKENLQNNSTLEKLERLIKNLLTLSDDEKEEIENYEKKKAETEKREKEYQVYLEKKQKLKSAFEDQKKIIKELKDHVQEFYGAEEKKSAIGDQRSEDKGKGDEEKKGDEGIPFLETPMGEGMEKIHKTLQTFISAKKTKDAFAEKLKMSSEGGDPEKKGKLHFDIKPNSWAALWEAAEKYSEEVAYPKEDFEGGVIPKKDSKGEIIKDSEGNVIPKYEFPYTGDGEEALCVLCQQTLQKEAKKRFEIFKKFVEFLEEQTSLEEQTEKTSYSYNTAMENYEKSLRVFFKNLEGFLGKDIFKRLSFRYKEGEQQTKNIDDTIEQTIEYLIAKSVGEKKGGTWSILGGVADRESGGDVEGGVGGHGGGGSGDGGKGSGDDSEGIDVVEQSVQNGSGEGSSSVNGEVKKGEDPKNPPLENIPLAQAIEFLYEEKLQQDLKFLKEVREKLIEKSGDKTELPKESLNAQDIAEKGSAGGQGDGKHSDGAKEGVPLLKNPLLADFLKETEGKKFENAIETLLEDYEKYFDEKLKRPVILFLEGFENCLEKSAENFAAKPAAKSAQQPTEKSDQTGIPHDHQDDHHLNAQKSAGLLSEILKQIEEIKFLKEDLFFEKIILSFEAAHRFLEKKMSPQDEDIPTALIALQGLSKEKFDEKIQNALIKLNEVENLGKDIKKLEALKEEYASQGAKTKVTNLSSEITKLIVGEKWKGTFKKELKKFGFDYLKLQHAPAEAKMAIGGFRTKHENKAVAPQYKDVKPKEILSGGEFRGVALSILFTELAVSKNNSAIVFDDPISSMDHTYVQQVADRFVEEAKSRQVIVFTHNQFFEEQLVEACGGKKVQYVQREIAKPSREGFSGYVLNDPSFTNLILEEQFKWLEDKKEKLKQEKFENWNDKEVRLFALNMRRWLEKFVREGLKAVEGPRGIVYKKLKRIPKFAESFKKRKEFEKVKKFCNEAVHYAYSARERKSISWNDLDENLKIIKDHFLPVAREWEMEKRRRGIKPGKILS